MKNRLSFNRKSIRFKLWSYFTLFAILIVSLIWLLQVVFLNQYYEEMKLREIYKLAASLNKEYDLSKSDFLLQLKVDEYCAQSDTFIRVEDGYGHAVVVPVFTEGNTPTYLYSIQATKLRDELNAGSESKITHIAPEIDESNKKTLTYATYMYKADDSAAESDNIRNSRILYIFSPLYPVNSTISIIRRQLVYITIISLLLALSMGLYLAMRISRPIRDITRSAAEMGKNNYSVKFHGSQYEEINDLAETLTLASSELEKTDMYQKDLIANVSHDLKTPLTMIKSYAEMIKDLSGDNPEKRNIHLSVIIEEADRLNSLVDDMLTLSKMQRRKIILDVADFDLAACVSHLLESYTIFSEEEGYTFYFEDPGPMFVHGDESKIKQVVSNLVNNAIKYCGEDKVVFIEIKKVSKKIRLEVTDHGQGIPADEINHVWDRYYKASTHHVRSTEGSGLGLSIVKEILTMHKAEFGVDSELGEGSTFWFELDEADLE